MLLRICCSWSWDRHTKLSFTVFAMTLVSSEDLVLLSACTLTTPMTLQRSVLLFSLVFRPPCSVWLTPPVSLYFRSLCHLSSSLGPCLAEAFCALFFWGTLGQHKCYSVSMNILFICEILYYILTGQNPILVEAFESPVEWGRKSVQSSLYNCPTHFNVHNQLVFTIVG